MQILCDGVVGSGADQACSNFQLQSILNGVDPSGQCYCNLSPQTFIVAEGCQPSSVTTYDGHPTLSVTKRGAGFGVLARPRMGFSSARYTAIPGAGLPPDCRVERNFPIG